MTDEGLTVHIANSDWTSMTDVTGTVFSKHTSDTSDLDKIDSYICGDFNAQQALVTTFDCLREGDDCGSWCRGVITTFPHNITNVSLDVTYATVSELEPNTKYVIDTELCSDASEPNYKCTHHFTDSYSQPVVTLEIDKDFYMANKDQMSGLCVGDDE
ncbi:hypothetical protein LSH36_1536g00003 [Paralvinella palmiformis]|uniref:Uncharacterized protein n=1 Tax=Paralvinella palmiformis TaxID=53620 RepID=A0AAD9ISA7_9ANNE|nr:hypothetical protein LSH36_1536g00003 [Paralvinella palmiformis]